MPLIHRFHFSSSKIFFLILSLLGPVSVSAQTETTAAIRGLITDKSGAVIVGAQINLRELGGKISRTTLTDAEGRYTFSGVTLDNIYEIQALAANFKPSVSNKISLRIGESQTINLALEVGEMTEFINTVAETPAVVSNAPEISQSIDARRINELPSNGRNLNRFALLDPHIRNTSGLGSDGSGSSRLAINGGSFRHTHYKVDGNSNYDPVFSNAPQMQFSLTAVQEFRLLTNLYSAEYGGSTTGIISVSTKAGTPQMHGQGFYFLRPSGIQARPPVSNLRTPNQWQQFGGALSGPIIQDKLVFFFNYEQSGSERGAFIQSPTPAVFTGHQSEHLAMLRTDWNLSAQHSLSGRLNANYLSNDNPGDAVSGFTQPSAARLNKTQSTAGQITEHYVFGTGVNELRAGYINTIPTQTRPISDATVVVVRPNYSTEGYSSFSLVRTQNLQIADVLAYQLGTHELKIGGEYLRQKIRDFSFTPFGTYTFAPGAPKASETPLQYTQTFGVQNIFYGQTLANGFVQDNWRIVPKLTLNLGLRYEFQSLTADRNNFAPRLGLAWDLKGDGSTIIRGGAGVFYDQYYLYITRRFFTQSGNSPTVTYTIPFGAPGFPTFPNSLNAPLTGTSEGLQNLYLRDQQLLNPYNLQFSLGIQHKFGSDWTMTIDAIHSRTLKQMRARDINAPIPFPRSHANATAIRSGKDADATRPFKTYNGIAVRQAVLIENSATSSYDALDLGIIKRLTNRFQLEGHYIYNSAITDSMFFGEPNTGVPNDWNGDFKLERGPSDFHQRHRFVGHGLVEMPWKTQAAFILTLASGLPVDPRTGVDNNGDANTVDRPVNPVSGAIFARNSCRAPRQTQFDLSLSKRIILNEKTQLELKAEGFNLSNHSNFIKVNNLYGNGIAPLATFLSPLAGAANVDPGRQFQFGARLIF